MAEEYLTDDEQFEAVKRWAGEYAPVLIVGALLGVGGYFGYNYYLSYRTDRALKAEAQFKQMTAALQSQDPKKPWDIAEQLARDYAGTPYGDHAQLTLARMHLEDGAADKAVAPLSAVMNDSKDEELRQIARMRLARVLIDQGKPDAAMALLVPEQAGRFAGRYHDIRGDALHAKHDEAGAMREYQAAMGSGPASAAAEEEAGVDTALLELKLADLGSARAKP